MKLKKVLLIIGTIAWIIFCVSGISKNYEHYRLVDYIIVFSFFLFPFAIYFLVKWSQKKSKEKYKKDHTALSKTTNPDLNCQHNSQTITDQVKEQTPQPSNPVNCAISPKDELPNKLNENIKTNTFNDKTLETPNEETQSNYIKVGNTYQRADGKPISDEDIPNLINIGYQQSIENEKQSTNIKFHRTEKEEEMSLQFMMSEHKELDKIINEFENFYRQSAKTDSIDEKIELLEKAVASFEKAKKSAYKTKAGKIYFQDMYEHMHNSRDEDFSYLDLIESELDALIDDRDYTIPTLKKIISEHNGIMQKDVYQYVSDIPKSEVQRYIKLFEKEGIIKRTKKGNSYVLELLQ